MKTINKFKDIAVVIIKDKSNVIQLLSKYSSSFLPPEYRVSYDLYVNGIKVDGDFLNPYDEYILDANTYKELTEDDIRSFLNEI